MSGKASEARDPDRPGKGGIVPPKETRWKPGKSANPGGLPKGYKRQDAIMRRLGLLSIEEFRDYKPKNWHEQMAHNQMLVAGLGSDNWSHLQGAQDRLDGKVAPSVESKEHAGTEVVLREKKPIDPTKDLPSASE